jgi:hypothetical protein
MLLHTSIPSTDRQDSFKLSMRVVLYSQGQHRGRIQRKTWLMGVFMGPYAGVDYNLSLCRLQHIYHGQFYARVDLYRMPESTVSPGQRLRIWPLLGRGTLHLQASTAQKSTPTYARTMYSKDSEH